MDAAQRPIEGLVAIVTGGGTGIGRATAHQLAAAGAKVLVAGRTADTLAHTAQGHPDIRTVVADLAAADAPDRIVSAALDCFGRLDVLVNNAAIIRPAALGDIDRAVAQAQLDTNLVAPIMLAQQAIPHLEPGGVIINVTSNSPHRGWPRNSVYGATKVALDFLTYTWAVELAPRGIRVVSIAPGPTETPVLVHAGFTAEQIAASGAALLSRIPLRRRARPEEIAWWIVNAARPEAGYLTGSVIRVDGGGNAV